VILSATRHEPRFLFTDLFRQCITAGGKYIFNFFCQAIVTGTAYFIIPSTVQAPFILFNVYTTEYYIGQQCNSIYLCNAKHNATRKPCVRVFYHLLRNMFPWALHLVLTPGWLALVALVIIVIMHAKALTKVSRYSIPGRTLRPRNWKCQCWWITF